MFINTGEQLQQVQVVQWYKPCFCNDLGLVLIPQFQQDQPLCGEGVSAVMCYPALALGCRQ